MPTVIHRAARRASSHLGAHGLGLCLIAGFWALIAIGQLTGTQTPEPGRHLLHQHIPTVAAATLWLTTAMGALASAIDRNGPRRDGLALAAAVIPPVIWAVSYLWSWIVSLIPGPPTGSPRGWFAASLYACAIGLVWLVAAIPDEEPPTTRTD